MKIVIIHGTYGNPGENWIPWLKSKLEEKGNVVYTPNLPTPENQNIDTWNQELEKQVPFIFDNDTVLIGHSLGATYLLSILDRQRKEPIKQAIFVSGFNSLLNNAEFDGLNKSFINTNYNWDRIKNNASVINIFHGSNDPYVPISEAENLKNKLNGSLTIIENGGHLNLSAGFLEFNELLNCIVKKR